MAECVSGGDDCGRGCNVVDGVEGDCIVVCVVADVVSVDFELLVAFGAVDNATALLVLCGVV